MKSKKKGKILAALLSGMVLGTQIPATAASEEASGYTGGICEHHPEHTEECGYQEAVPEQPCLHEHTEECFEYVTSCVHEHTEECYPLIAVVSAEAQDTEGTAEDAGLSEEPQTELVRGEEPAECTHVCSEESGCVTKTLNCIHEDRINADGSITYAVHDESCGYAPAVEGAECTFVCEICSTPEEPEEVTEVPEEENVGVPEEETVGEQEEETVGVPEEETVGEQEDAAVTALQKRINELPDVETVKQMTAEEQNGVYNQAQDIADTYYDELTEEQQRQVDLTRLTDLMNFFNEQVSTMADVIKTGLGGTFYSDGLLMITSGEWLNFESIMWDVGFKPQSIKSIIIGENVEGCIVANGALRSCENLTSVTVEKGAKITIDDRAFDDIPLTSVTVEEGAEITIGDGAFIFCRDLTEIRILGSVTDIGNSAFGYCSSLTKVILPATVPAADSKLFDGTELGKINFIIPEDSIEAYLQADPWKDNIKKINGCQVENGQLVISTVAVTLEEPLGSQPLPEVVTCDLSKVSGTVAWTKTTVPGEPEESVAAGTAAEYGTTYTAKVTLSSPPIYKFEDQVTVTLNGETVTEANVTDNGSTLTFTQSYTTEELVAVVTFADDETPHNYASLDEAFAATADKTAMIELKKNASFSSTVTITGTVTFEGGNSKATSTNGAYINVWGTFITKSGTITFETLAGINCSAGGKADISGGAIEDLQLSGGTANISGGAISTLDLSLGTANISEGAISTLDLYGGKADISGGTVSNMNLNGDGTADINGGTVERLFLNGGTADISGGTVKELFGSVGKVIYSATSISLDKDKLSFAPDSEGELTATVAQNTITVENENISVPVTWESSDKTVATVASSNDDRIATITAVGPGEATITAAAGTPTATCTVTVEKNITTITNKDENGCRTSFIHGDTIPNPDKSNFTITGSNEGFSYQWYSGDHTAGELPAENIVKKPDAAGTYTLVVATAETNTYFAGELRLLVEIAAAEYHITIPGSVKAGDDEVSVSITEDSTFKIGSNGKVRVTVSGGAQNGTVTLTQQNAGENPAEITSKLLNGEDGSPLKDGDSVALYDASKNLIENTTGKLYFTAPKASEGDVIPAGSYSGTVTFQISYEIHQEESAG